MGMSTFILVVLALFLPPIPVAIRKGCSGHLILNILLLLLAWFPAAIHAWIVIFAYDKDGVKKKRDGVQAREENEKAAMMMGNQQGYYGPQPVQDFGPVKKGDEIQSQPQHQQQQQVPEYARDMKV